MPPLRAWFGSILERRLAPPFYRNTPIVTLSASSRRELLANLGHRPEGVYVVEPGIHPRFRPEGKPEAAPLVLSVGRLMPSKGVDQLLEAVSLARQSVHDLRLEVVGEGPEEGALRQRATDLGISEAVQFRGRVDDEALVSAYRRATVVASASVSEGWGMTLTEAAACGTPAVASDIDGHRDSVQHGTSGLLAADRAGIAAALVEVASNPARRAELAAGATRMATRFDWDRTATEAFRVLASTVSHR
jgi:glycosyltransferase involved in cell wall biosynthesis